MKNKGMMKLFCLLLVAIALFACATMVVSAEEATEPTTQAEQQQENSDASSKALPAALVVGLAAVAGAISMGLAIGKSVEGISRQPESAGNIRTSLMLGLIFIETVVIYALIVAILIVFIL